MIANTSHNSLTTLAQQLSIRQPLLILSGAGISTESGIPDYRGPVSRQKPRQPIRFQAFLKKEEARKRYWAGSMKGWPLMSLARPNRAHQGVARLEQQGLLSGIITQNVDALHQQAGSRSVIDLHGNISLVKCLSCERQSSRQDVQRQLIELNPHFRHERAELAPDGDADIAKQALANFKVPSCLRCGGVLKPDVVFFGENVPKPRVASAMHLLSEANALLVLGSSLTVYSGYRFALRAHQEQKPVFIINQGETRADALAEVKLELPLGDAISSLVEMFSPSRVSKPFA